MDIVTELHINIYGKMNGLWNDSKDVRMFYMQCNFYWCDMGESKTQYNKPLQLYSGLVLEGWTDTAVTLKKYCNMLNIKQLYYGLLSPLLIWNYCDSNLMFGNYFFNIFDVLEYKGIYIYHYGFSLLHKCSMVL